MKNMRIGMAGIAGGRTWRGGNTNTGAERRPNEETKDMNRKLTRWFGAVAIMVVGALVMLAGVRPAHGGSLRTWSIDGAGTWDDDTTPDNWGGGAVAMNSDRALINRTNGATVDYASTNFSGANRLLATGSSSGSAALTLGGSGGINTLQIGSGDTLQVDAPGFEWAGVRIDNGGQLNISGGTVEDVTGAVNYPHSVMVNNGGSVTVSGTGVLKLPAQGSVSLANTAGHSASLTVSGSGQFTYPATTGTTGGDFDSSEGNSTVSVSDSGVLRVARDLLVGTTGGTHNWTINGGTVQRAGATGSGWQLGNNNGNGSVTFIQSGGSFSNANHTTYLRGTARYTMSGNAYMAAGYYLHVDGTLTQSNGYVKIDGELYVGNTAGQSGQYTATAGNLYTRGLHIADVADSSGTLTLNAGVTYTNYSLNGSADQRIAIGATSGAGTGTFEIKGLNNIANAGGGGFTQVYLNQTGVIRGYGTLSAYGLLQVNGRVIADGYGSDQTLALGAGNDPLTSTVENTTDRGLYAVNGGKLTLKNLTIASDNSTSNWGEDASDTEIDLVNSARIAFTGSAGGTLTGSLLATDRTDVPAGLQRSIGVWQMTSPNFTSAVLTFRYDDGALAAQGISEGTIQLQRYDGSAWVDVAVTQDAANNRVTTSPISPIDDGQGYLGLFAIHAPPQGTVISIR
jgi:hypothetical protein